ncbi:heavy metal translocating P-type ATPase [Bifidobacterium boum]|uniref:Heavy metal translocating P-type ATPase n=1 Tax=Bifidobacterium boum TaxID=78343 RepID=A0A848D7Z3_9BIFI|nr:heavy metal translocating P-type ATPase [Bifidobacterium boum]NMF02558.1 heavy metal translocating P-type ATPase [Bifidobacterium boum]
MRRIIDLCKRVPLLPITIICALPIALLWNFRPWGHSLGSLDPSLGQYLIIALVAYTVIDTIIGMVDDLRHGHVGVDILAVIAILSTVAVGEYWAAWTVVLMVWSGEAIEEYAQSKAESNLTALIKAAPQTAHITTLPGVGAESGKTQSGEDGFHKTASATGGTADSADTSDSASAAVSNVSSDSNASVASNDNMHFRTVPVEEVKLDDVLTVLPGETVPVDGVLMSGQATLDLSNINGEPVPREVFAGARVMSGAVNGSTAFTMRATQLSHDSQYQRILELVSSAQNSRATVVKTADILAVPFTVISLVIACVAWGVSGVPTRFAQVLVLATPCPLLIAAPVAYMAGTGRLAKAGILIKAQEVLENLGRVSHIFFDKTGTLTVKQPQVVRVDLLPDAGADIPVHATATGMVATGAEHAGVGVEAGAAHARIDKDHILMLAGVVETYSVHILSKGIVKAGAAALDRLHDRYDKGNRNCAQPATDPGHRRGDYPVVKNIHEDAGKGISGTVNGLNISVGRFAYVTQAQVDAGLQPQSATPLDFFPDSRFGGLAPDEMATYVAVNGKLAARIVMKDVPRPNAKESLQRLRGLGVERLTMVTGDKEPSARIIADEVGITDVHAELLPEDKVNTVRSAAQDKVAVQPWWDRIIQKLVGESTTRPVSMMVGDGVNDAPVLAAADIGMAMTDGTTTAASESAQVVIMNDDIACVPKAIAIARRTKRVMLQAVVAGLSLAIVGMVCAAFNLIPAVVGAFLQEAIDVVSILWALTALLDRE